MNDFRFEFFCSKGQAAVYQRRGPNEDPIEVSKLGASDYFGKLLTIIIIIIYNIIEYFYNVTYKSCYHKCPNSFNVYFSNFDDMNHNQGKHELTIFGHTKFRVLMAYQWLNSFSISYFIKRNERTK